MSNSDHPNVLFLAHRVPFPPNRGDRIRSWNILQYLAERANVHLACCTDEPISTETIHVLNRHCRRVFFQPLSRTGRWGRAALSMASGRSATEGLFASPTLHRVVQSWNREIVFDSTFVLCSSMYQFARTARQEHSTLVADFIDVDSEKWRNYAESAPLGKRQLYQIESRRVRRLETDIAEHADVVTLVSEQEVDVLRRFCPAENIVAVPNGVDLDYFHPADCDDQDGSCDASASDARTTPAGSLKLAFVGVLNYRANVEGLQWFCHNVWSRLREQIPQVELHLIGRHAGDPVRRLARMPGVTLIGEVDDVRPPVWNADIVIAPLKVARGIQNKVLEAMAMAKPIIATPQAIEGTGAVPGQHLVSAATPDEWTEAITGLFGTPHLRRSLGLAARRDAETRFAWPHRLVALERLMKLGQPRRRQEECRNCERPPLKHPTPVNEADQRAIRNGVVPEPANC